MAGDKIGFREIRNGSSTIGRSKKCKPDKRQVPCKMCGSDGCVYLYGSVYLAECESCDNSGHYTFSTKTESIEEWNELNVARKETP
jgi:hypothetical protein